MPDNEGGRVRTPPEDGFGDLPAAIVSFHHRTLTFVLASTLGDRRSRSRKLARFVGRSLHPALHRLLEHQRVQSWHNWLPHPQLDRIANEGAIFTDYYGQQSCTAGRAALITGRSPMRTGLNASNWAGLIARKLGFLFEPPGNWRARLAPAEGSSQAAYRWCSVGVSLTPAQCTLPCRF
jgi:Sulfatase